jgi:hypothetical protein
MLAFYLVYFAKMSLFLIHQLRSSESWHDKVHFYITCVSYLSIPKLISTMGLLIIASTPE